MIVFNNLSSLRAKNMDKKTKVVLIQLGSPKSPKVADVRSYLKEFLADPRVVDAPRLMWLFILYVFVLPFRSKKSAHAYSYIWDGNSFPLVSITHSFLEKLKKKVSRNVELEACFILSSPRIGDVYNKWKNENYQTRADHWVIFPQFPQYAESTTASVFDVVSHEMMKQVNIPSLSFISSFHLLKVYIDTFVERINKVLSMNQEIQHLLISFHGIPLRRVKEKKDIYYDQCLETFNCLREKVNISSEKIHLCFQSKFGKEEWLGPATSSLALDLAKKGSKTIAVCCPSFTVDCLETTVEIGIELKEELSEYQTEVILVPSLNDFDDWVEKIAPVIDDVVRNGIQQIRNHSYQN